MERGAIVNGDGRGAETTNTTALAAPPAPITNAGLFLYAIPSSSRALIKPCASGFFCRLVFRFWSTGCSQLQSVWLFHQGSQGGE